jgi:hypothetical protein
MTDSRSLIADRLPIVNRSLGYTEMWVTEGFTARLAVKLLEIYVSGAGCSPDRRGHGSSILKNEQQVFTQGVNLGNTWEKDMAGFWNLGDIRRFVGVE